MQILTSSPAVEAAQALLERRVHNLRQALCDQNYSPELRADLAQIFRDILAASALKNRTELLNQNAILQAYAAKSFFNTHLLREAILTLHMELISFARCGGGCAETAERRDDLGITSAAQSN